MPQHYRREVWGMDRMAVWEPMLPERGLDGLGVRGDWKREFDAVVGSGKGGGTDIAFGGEDWLDYEISVSITCEEGGNGQVLFRIDAGGGGGYMLDLLYGWQAVAISRFGARVEKLSVVNHELVRGRRYDVELAVRGYSVTSYLEGGLVNQVTLPDCRPGRFALSVWQGRTRFADLKARRLG